MPIRTTRNQNRNRHTGEWFSSRSFRTSAASTHTHSRCGGTTLQTTNTLKKPNTRNRRTHLTVCYRALFRYWYSHAICLVCHLNAGLWYIENLHVLCQNKNNILHHNTIRLRRDLLEGRNRNARSQGLRKSRRQRHVSDRVKWGLNRFYHVQ